MSDYVGTDKPASAAKDASASIGGDMALIEVREIRKAFGGPQVLDGISLSLFPGELVALAGENGAGKSTLIKIIAGVLRPDAGDIVVDGQTVTKMDPHSAHTAGIAFIPQELAPVLDMAIYENIFLGRELKTRFGTLDRGRMRREALSLLQDFGLSLNPDTLMRRLSVARQQMVEIIKAVSSGCRVLLLDEPTSAISGPEIEHLYGIIAGLKQRGVAMLYTTHKMAEIRALSTHVIVLRDGRLTTQAPIAEISDDEIVSAMIGRELEDLFPAKRLPTGKDEKPALELRQLRLSTDSGSIDLHVRPGEIVALAGLAGAGRTSMLETVFGVHRPHSGTVLIRGTELVHGRPDKSIASRVALVPEDRKVGGAVLGMSILNNGILPHLNRHSRLGVIRRRRSAAAVSEAMAAVRLRHTSLSQHVGTLSGGNQQKVVLGRWLTGNVDVLLLDEPTRGVDVGARSEIYRIVTDLAASGMAVLMASSDMPEVLGLAHRVLVIRDRQIAAELFQSDLESPDIQERLFLISAGQAAKSTKGAHTNER